MGGDIVYSLTGHTSFVYSLSVLPNGDVVSGGEDRSVRIWRGTSSCRIACSLLLVHSSSPLGDAGGKMIRISGVDPRLWSLIVFLIELRLKC